MEQQMKSEHADGQGLFRVIVAGSRHFADYALLEAKLDLILREKVRTHRVTIISGTARGADTLGERYAQQHGLQVMRFPADWNRFGRSAGPKRNLQMADHADAVVAFLAPGSRGTAHMISVARERGLPLRIIHFA